MDNIPQTINATVPLVKSLLPEAPFIADDMVLFYNQCCNRPISSEEVTANGICIVLCLEGTLNYTVDSKKITMQKNDLLLINEGKVISHDLTAGKARYIGIYGSRNFFQEVVKDFHNLSQIFLFIRNNPLLHLPEYMAVIFRNYYNIMQNRIVMRDHRFRREVVTSLFRCLIYDMCDHIWSIYSGLNHTANTRAEMIFNKFIGLLEVNFKEQRRVSWYAQQMNISPKYLSETVREVSGETPNAWIDKFVILELRSLLRNTSLNIKEITYRMHFPNQSFLGKYFKKHVGISPTEYRENR